MNNLYISAKDLQNNLNISYQSARRIIEEVRKEMKERNYLIPNTKTKLALTWMVKKRIGLKEWIKI